MTKRELAVRLNALSQQMISTAERMAQHEGELYQQHATELENVGHMVAMWYLAVMEEADGLE